MQTAAGMGGTVGAFAKADPKDAGASGGQAAKARVGTGFTATVTSGERPPVMDGVVRAARV
jgi:hypothetical protein